MIDTINLTAQSQYYIKVDNSKNEGSKSNRPSIEPIYVVSNMKRAPPIHPVQVLFASCMELSI